MPKKNPSRRRARRGYGLLITLLVAAALIFNADRIAQAIRGSIDLVAIMPEAPGIRVGSSVRVAGVEAGTVTRVGLAGGTDSARVAVHLRLRPDTRQVITQSSNVYATRDRLIGQPLIQVAAGRAGEPPVEPNDTLWADPRPNPLALIEQGRAIPGALDSLVTAVRRIQELAGQQAPEVRRLASQLETVTVTASALSQDLSGGSLGALLDPERGLGARLDRLRGTLGELQEAVGRVTQRYAPGGTGALAEGLENLEARSNRLDQALAVLQQRVADGRGAIPRARRDSALAVAVRGVQVQLDSLAANLQALALEAMLP